jgi:hypothetical protein
MLSLLCLSLGLLLFKQAKEFREVLVLTMNWENVLSLNCQECSIRGSAWQHPTFFQRERQIYLLVLC